jgi:hypothetical protein
MRITIDFENWDEMEAFRTSGKKTRGKKGEENDPVETGVEIVAQPLPPQPSFTPPVQPVAGFPGANGAAPPAVNPLAVAIAAKADNAIAGGQSAEQVLNWFRGQIGPDAASATWDQIKSVYLPRLPEAQLKTIAPQLGIT